jgi:hypothetical protein
MNDLVSEYQQHENIVTEKKRRRRKARSMRIC